MSRTMPWGRLRAWIWSILAPERAMRLARLTSLASHSVSKRPIWADAAYRRRSGLVDPSLVRFSAIR
jgi:hypothetical protein